MLCFESCLWSLVTDLDSLTVHGSVFSSESGPVLTGSTRPGPAAPARALARLTPHARSERWRPEHSVRMRDTFSWRCVAGVRLTKSRV